LLLLLQVDAATDSHLFYYYVESQTAPATDPLVWWFNGECCLLCCR